MPCERKRMMTWTYVYTYGTYRVILRIVKTGCHPVAIAQVVEH